MLIAHPFLGIVTTKIYLNKADKPYSKVQILLTLIWGIITGIGPDWDFFLVPILSLPAAYHHWIITHTPVFWLLVAFVIWVVQIGLILALHKKTTHFIYDIITIPLVPVLLLNVFVHLLADSVVGGILWLYPFYKRPITILGYIIPYATNRKGYFSHPVFVLELIIITIAMQSILPFPKLQKAAKQAFNALLIIFVWALGWHFYTYHTAVGLDYIPDHDYDLIVDTKDTDASGNGIENMFDSAQVSDSNIQQIAADLSKKTTIALPLSLQNNKIAKVVSQPLNIINSNLDLVTRVYLSSHFSLKHDVLVDICTHPSEYNITYTAGCYQNEAYYTVHSLYTYLTRHQKPQSDYSKCHIAFANTSYGMEVYLITSTSNNQVMALSTTNEMFLTTIQINPTAVIACY